MDSDLRVGAIGVVGLLGIRNSNQPACVKLSFVSPTILRAKGFRFYFFSREERRAHVHVQHADGEAKFWIDPSVELAVNFSLKPKQVTEVEHLIDGAS